MGKRCMSWFCCVRFSSLNADHELQLSGRIGFDLIKTAPGFGGMQINGRIGVKAVMQGRGDAAPMFFARRARKEQITAWSKTALLKESNALHEHGDPGEIIGNTPAKKPSALDCGFEGRATPCRLVDTTFGIGMSEQQQAACVRFP